MSKWQPIETAPVGEDVLLYSPIADVTCMIGHRFGEGAEEDWYPQHETTLNGAAFDVDMTHWQPLPEPPK